MREDKYESAKADEERLVRINDRMKTVKKIKAEATI